MHSAAALSPDAISTDAPTVPVGTLIPQPHGGALRYGGTNRSGGGGLPPSALREKLRGSFESRLKVLEEIADGEPAQTLELPLRNVLPHLKCPDCGGEDLQPKDRKAVTVQVRVSAQPNDRIKAVDVMGKYGLGESNTLQVIHPEVIQRIQGTVQTIQDFPGLSIEQREQLLDAIEAVWA